MFYSQVSFMENGSEMCGVLNEGNSKNEGNLRNMKAFVFINKAQSVTQSTSIAAIFNAFLPTVLLTIIKPTII